MIPGVGGVQSIEALVLLLLVFVALFAALARKLKVPYPILLVIAGLLLGFVPGMPRINLDPDIVEHLGRGDRSGAGDGGRGVGCGGRRHVSRGRYDIRAVDPRHSRLACLHLRGTPRIRTCNRRTGRVPESPLMNADGLPARLCPIVASPKGPLDRLA